MFDSFEKQLMCKIFPNLSFIIKYCIMMRNVFFFKIIGNKDPLEIQHPNFENSRLGFIESVHDR